MAKFQVLLEKVMKLRMGAEKGNDLGVGKLTIESHSEDFWGTTKSIGYLEKEKWLLQSYIFQPCIPFEISEINCTSKCGLEKKRIPSTP